MRYGERMIERIREVANAYGLRSSIDRVEHCFRGRMHQTWFAGSSESEPEFDLVFQKMNTAVFQDLDALMANVSQVSRHLKEKMALAGVRDAERRFLHLRHTLEDDAYFLEEDGSCWRVCDYVKEADCVSSAESPAQAYQVAKGYGHFMSLLVDFPAKALTETIPGFHDTAKRLKMFERVVKGDLVERARGAADEIAFVYDNDRLATVLATAFKDDLVSLRVVHNDTKISNVLLDRASGESVCVIDLDTVMPGLSVNDFGDMARSIACTKAENDHDWRGTEVDLDLYKALVDGYLAGAGSVFKKSEIDLFATSAMVLTYELGMRFLTDYLSGDLYFHVDGEQDNLDRARVQFELCRSMVRRRSDMEDAV